MRGMREASNIVLVGPMGAGKSSVGRALAARLGCDFVDADEAIERRSGRRIAEIFEHDGEPAFRALERTLLCELLDREACVIATGGGAVLDAGSRRLMRERGRVVHLHVPVEVQLQRLEGDRTRPLLMRPDREAALRALAAVRDPLYDEAAHLRIDADRGDAQAVAARIEARLFPPDESKDNAA